MDPPKEDISNENEGEGSPECVPIGLEAIKLATFEGMVAQTIVLIIYDDWRHVPEDLKRKIWDFVCDHFGVDPESRKKTLQDNGVKWKSFKYTLNKNFVIPFVDKSGKLTLSTKQMEKQAKNKYNHKLSRKGYANLIEEIKQETRLTEEEIDRSLTWKLARKRKWWRVTLRLRQRLTHWKRMAIMTSSVKHWAPKNIQGQYEVWGSLSPMGSGSNHQPLKGNAILAKSVAVDNTCYLVVDFSTNIVAKGTIMEYEGPNVWVIVDVVFGGSPSLPFPNDEEFLVKGSDAIGHRLLWQEELV
ncbi:hypothetical protein Pint_22699 [Pistacia integerrima]|uniref:Uncharacterized protein n=1 Tax=Pistacia integerrima TaxID=434235 RepID=A0ACC0YK15_9ROSI|nr:hypothetical protein Pint_22699 [Pistacia integerrima]